MQQKIVLRKMSSSVDENDLPKSEVNFDLNTDYPKNAWIVRPCEWYRQEYNDCKCFTIIFIIIDYKILINCLF
jgi:hypothetical protein